MNLFQVGSRKVVSWKDLKCSGISRLCGLLTYPLLIELTEMYLWDYLEELPSYSNYQWI